MPSIFELDKRGELGDRRMSIPTAASMPVSAERRPPRNLELYDRLDQ